MGLVSCAKGAPRKRTSFGTWACAKTPAFLVVVILVQQLFFLRSFHNETSTISAAAADVATAVIAPGHCCLPHSGCVSLRTGCMPMAEYDCLQRGGVWCGLHGFTPIAPGHDLFVTDKAIL